MTMTVTTTATARTLRLANDLDATTAPLLRRHLARLSEGGGDVVVDLSGVTHVDAAGVRVLAQGRRLLERRGDRLVLARPAPAVARVLRMVRLPWLETDY